MQFTVFGIPVVIRLSFFLLSGLIAYQRAAQPLFLVEWIAVVLLAVLVHELGHALAYRRFGHAPAIELYGMGGLTFSRGGRPLRLGEDAVVSFAGPFFGFLLAGVVYGVAHVFAPAEKSAFASILVADLLWVSAGWSVMNLLPILPLDGGNLMLTAMRVLAPERAMVRAHALSLIVALAAAGAARYFDWTFSLYLALWFAYGNGRVLLDLRQAREGSANAPETSATSGAAAQFDAACEAAAAGQLEAAYAGVDRAIHSGFRDLARFDGEPRLAPLRDAVRWPSLRASLLHRAKSSV